MTNSANNSARQQVFISYSREPAENSEFVRDLAGWLSQIRFFVWLDEEQIPAASSIQAEIRKAINESDVGIFVITSRWVKREWTQYEVILFGGRKNSRRLGILREDIDLGDLGPYLSGLNFVNWSKEDDERYAHYWEIYCGITNTPPGRKSEWANKARSLTGDFRDENTSKPLPDFKLPQGQQPLPFTGCPIRLVKGEKWTFVITDREEWLGISAEGELHSEMNRLGDYTNVTFGANQELLVGKYEPMIVRLREKHWEYLPQRAPVLCFTVHQEQNFAGTAAGTVILIDDALSVNILQIRDPVIALASFESGLAVLGSRGLLGYISTPFSHENTLKWINSDKLGRVVGLFDSVDYDQVGFYSQTMIAVADPVREELIICQYQFKEGIREVIFLGAQTNPYAVLTDAGNLFIVDAGLSSVQPVRFPRLSHVIGCCPSPPRDLLVWTSEGSLYAISSGGCKELFRDDVVLAYQPYDLNGILHLIRYDAKKGASLEQIKVS